MKIQYTLALTFCYSKEDAGMSTAKLRDEKEVFDKELNAGVEAKKNLEENMQQLRSRENEILSQERELRAKLNKILHSIPKHEDELAHLREEHNKIAKERQTSGLVRTKSFDLDRVSHILKHTNLHSIINGMFYFYFILITNIVQS